MEALSASEKQFKVTRYMSYVFFVLINISGTRGWETFCILLEVYTEGLRTSSSQGASERNIYKKT